MSRGAAPGPRRANSSAGRGLLVAGVYTQIGAARRLHNRRGAVEAGPKARAQPRSTEALISNAERERCEAQFDMTHDEYEAEREALREKSG